VLSRLRTFLRAVGWVGLVFLLGLVVQIVFGRLGLNREFRPLRFAGKNRLDELISLHSHLCEDQIMEAVWKGVREWSGDGELADGMTLLLARKL
jgi:hypothetical protein